MGGNQPPKPPPGAGGTRVRAAEIGNKKHGQSPYGKSGKGKPPPAAAVGQSQPSSGPGTGDAPPPG